jgi:hypothetical protein
MTMLADIGSIVRITPQDDLCVIEAAGRKTQYIDDRTPFTIRVAGWLEDGQVFYGLHGPVLAGPPRYQGLVCTLSVRTDATDWRKEKTSQVNFKVAPVRGQRNHRHDFRHPEGIVVDGFPVIARFGIAEVLEV